MGFVGEGWLRPVPLGTRIDLCLPHSPPAALRGPACRSNRLVLLNRMRFRRSCVRQQVPSGIATDFCLKDSVSPETVSPQVPRAHRQRVCSTNMRRPGAVPFAGCGYCRVLQLICTYLTLRRQRGICFVFSVAACEVQGTFCSVRVPLGRRADLYLSTKCDFVRSRAGRSRPMRRPALRRASSADFDLWYCHDG